MGAGRHWAAMALAGPAPQDDDAQRRQIEMDAARFGIPASRLADIIGADDGPDTYAVWAENWETISLFARCDTQWRFMPGIGLTGLDYAGVETVLRMHGLRAARRREIFEGIQVVEQGVMEAMNGQQ